MNEYRKSLGSKRVDCDVVHFKVVCLEGSLLMTSYITLYRKRYLVSSFFYNFPWQF